MIIGKKKSDEGAKTKQKKPADRPTKISSKPGPKAAPKLYTDDIDLPPSDDELDFEEAQKQIEVRKKPTRAIGITASDKELKNREKRVVRASRAAELAHQEDLRDDRDAFIVTISKTDADENIKDISIDKFSVSAGGNCLLHDASLKISHGKRYGLVGPNGMGKSTLLKLLAWRKVPVPKNVDVLFVEQEVVGDDRTAVEAVVSAKEELCKLRQEAASLQDESTDNVGEKLSELYDKLQLMGSDAAEAWASRILAGLGFSKSMLGRPTRSLSGGWRMRVSLAQALFIQPSLLLLDEPTNHLDCRAAFWLEVYLSMLKKTLLVVSHDRDFFNTVCNEIIHLHEKKLDVYRGNFDDFESSYQQRRKNNNKKSEIYEKQLKAAKRSGNQAQQKRVKERAQFMEAPKKNLGKRNDGPPKKWKDYKVEFHFPEPTELAPPVLQLINVGFTYHNGDDFKLSNVDIGIDMGTRVAIVGPNGAGKSTLFNLLTGDLAPTEGEVRRNPKLRIGRYSQHFVDLLTMHESPVQYLLRLHPDQEGPSKQEAVRAKLAKFGLPSHNHWTPIAKLSGGQKARVVFTSISMSGPHILLLDEPTNHLDMQSIDALADALGEFKGGVVLVSHDWRLISRVCQDEETSQLWVVENGNVEVFPGSFQEYKEEVMEEIRAELKELFALIPLH